MEGLLLWLGGLDGHWAAEDTFRRLPCLATFKSGTTFFQQVASV